MPAETSTSCSFAALCRGLREHVQAGELDQATRSLDTFHERVVAAVVARDRSMLAQLRGQAARLRRAVDGAGDVASLASDLRRIERTLEIAWTAEAMTGTRQAPSVPEQFTLRARLLEELRAGPRRPRDVAIALGVDRTQVSRELRQLAREGRVRSGRGHAEDRRAVFWELV